MRGFPAQLDPERWRRPPQRAAPPWAVAQKHSVSGIRAARSAGAFPIERHRMFEAPSRDAA
jgi:hypothetical protein